MAATPETLYGLGIALILVGALVILISLLLLFLKGARGEGKVKGGGAIIIGPFPIIFGTDKESLKTVLWLALALTILLIIAMVLFHLMLK
ncbi:MAG: TIGR00304 family membrane protein [Candidatus Bathyarchaeales archaeon]